MLTFGVGSSDRSLAMRVGETVEMQLVENPSSGFRWGLVADGRPYCSVESEPLRPGSTVPGASRRRSWKIHALAAGACEVELAYRRAWEAGINPAHTVRLHIRVT
jgi:inhibitor of cysteine peptidase